MPKCSDCEKQMSEGYYIRGNINDEYYCSDECLHKYYSPEEWKKMYEEDNQEDRVCNGDNCYWTTWEEEDD